MYEIYYRHKQKIDRIMFFLLIFVAVFLFFTVLFQFLAPFFFGLIIALLMEPLIRMLVKRLKFKRWIASLVCLLLFLAATSSLGVWLVTTLVRQVASFVESAPAHIEDLAAMLEEANLMLARWSEFLPEAWVIPNIQEMFLATASAFFGEGMRGQWVQTLTTVPIFFVDFILAIVSAYFFMSDRTRIFETLKNACPHWIVVQMRQTRAGLSKAMAGYFRAQGILMIMVGVISIIGLMILRSPYALFLGFLFAILDFLPILGPAIVLIPWALLSLVMGNFQQAIGLLVIYGVITVSRQVLQPKILGDQMGAHPLASLMSIFIGFRIFGLLGFIVGPSLLMIFIAIREASIEEAGLHV